MASPDDDPKPDDSAPVALPDERSESIHVVPALARGTREISAGRRRTTTARDGVAIVSVRAPIVVLAILGNDEAYEPVLDWVRRRGLIVDIVATGEQGLAVHREHGADLILLGLPLPDHRATSIIDGLRAQDPRATIVVVGTDADVRSQLTALELGAQEYVADPIEGRRDLLFALGVSLGVRSSDPHARVVRARESTRAEWRKIVAGSPAMGLVMKRLREICERSLSGMAPVVLFTGELGTGRHLLARALHYNGPRRHRPFAEINCATVPPDELRAQLFGRAHGAARQGLFESTDGGTLLLDEIGAAPADVQRDLLAAIEDRQIHSPGVEAPIYIDVQIVASTRHDLAGKARRGEFAADLYHRLSTRAIVLPPLRARGPDILAIAEALLAELAAECGVPTPQLAFDARDALLHHSWPGNIRELRNELERIVLLGGEPVIRGDQLRLASNTGAVAIASDGKLTVTLTGDHCPIDRLEYEVIREGLRRNSGNITRSARFLGITRQTMLYRLKKHGLRGASTPDDPDEPDE